MYLSNIKLWNFRKFGTPTEIIPESLPNLDLNFTKGLNVIIGENDSGKTAIIDAVKLVLKTHSYDYIKVEDKDFHNSTSYRLQTEKNFKETLQMEYRLRELLLIPMVIHILDLWTKNLIEMDKVYITGKMEEL